MKIPKTNERHDLPENESTRACRRSSRCATILITTVLEGASKCPLVLRRTAKTLNSFWNMLLKSHEAAKIALQPAWESRWKSQPVIPVPRVGVSKGRACWRGRLQKVAWLQKIWHQRQSRRCQRWVQSCLRSAGPIDAKAPASHAPPNQFYAWKAPTAKA